MFNDLEAVAAFVDEANPDASHDNPGGFTIEEQSEMMEMLVEQTDELAAIKSSATSSPTLVGMGAPPSAWSSPGTPIG